MTSRTWYLQPPWRSSSRLASFAALNLAYPAYPIFSISFKIFPRPTPFPSFPYLKLFATFCHLFPVGSAYRQSRPVVRQRSAKWQTWKGNCKQSMPQTFGLFWIILLPYFGIFWILDPFGPHAQATDSLRRKVDRREIEDKLNVSTQFRALHISLSLYIYILHWDFNQHQIGWPPFTFLKMVSLRQDVKLGDPTLVKTVKYVSSMFPRFSKYGENLNFQTVEL